MAEIIRRSKDLVEIDPLPDTQDEALTYTCSIDSEGRVQAAEPVAFVEKRGATDSLLSAICQAVGQADKSSE